MRRDNALLVAVAPCGRDIVSALGAERRQLGPDRSYRQSVLRALHRLDDPRPRTTDQGGCCSRRSPHLAFGGEKGRRLARAVEVEADHDVVRVVDRAEDPVASHPRLLPASRVAIAGRLPGVEVADLVFEAQGVLLRSPFTTDCGSGCSTAPFSALAVAPDPYLAPTVIVPAIPGPSGPLAWRMQ